MLLMLIEKQDETEVVPQELVAVTQIEPPAVPEVTLIAVVPCPELMVHPVGTTHA